MSIIKARNVTKSYKMTQALKGVDLDIQPGRIIGLIGPNGAGKTTLLNALLGLTQCEGDIEVLGLNPHTNRDQMMNDVCFIADVAILPKWIRCDQVADFVEGVHPKFSREKFTQFMSKTKVPPKAKVKALSKGMTVQLHLALVMSIDAKLLVLDEPTLGLDILFRKQFYQSLLNDYFDDEKTILITTHQVEEIEQILSDIIFIKDGMISLQSSMDDIGERFTELAVPVEQANEARALRPLYESQVFGRHIFVYDGVSRQQLQELGDIRTPNISDLFVATMQEMNA